MTIYHQRHDYRLLEEPQQTLNDDELRQVLVGMRLHHPYNGESMTVGCSYKVKRISHT